MEVESTLNLEWEQVEQPQFVLQQGNCFHIQLDYRTSLQCRGSHHKCIGCTCLA